MSCEFSSVALGWYRARLDDLFHSLKLTILACVNEAIERTVSRLSCATFSTEIN